MLAFGYFKKPESGAAALPTGALSGGSDVQLIQSLCSSVRSQHRPGSQPDLQKVCATTTMCGLHAVSTGLVWGEGLSGTLVLTGWDQQPLPLCGQQLPQDAATLCSFNLYLHNTN